MVKKIFKILFLIIFMFTFTVVDLKVNPNVEVNAQEQKWGIYDCYIEDISAKSYTGKVIKPNPVIIDGDRRLLLNKDYKLTYKNNKNLGTATVTIKGIGKYTGTISKKFSIVVSKPNKVRLSTYDTSSITIKWDKPSGSINGYAVYYSDNINGTYKKVFTTKTSFKASKLKSGKTYYFKVRAFKTIKGSKKYSTYSDTLIVSTKLSTPVVSLSKYNNSIDIDYNKVSGATGYEIYYSTNNSSYTKLVDTTRNYYTLNNLDYNKNYYFKVRAYKVYDNKVVYSNYSKVVKESISLRAPTIKLSSGYDYVNLSWNYISDAKAYEIYRSNSLNGTYKLIGATIYNYFEDEDLDSNKKYYYKVRAYNNNYYGPFSSVKSTTTDLYLDTPVISLTSGTNNIKISWNKVVNASKYQVYRSTSLNGTYTKIATTSSTSYNNTGLSKNKTYYYKVRAYTTTADGKTKYSSYSTIKYIKTLSNVKNITTNINFSGIFSKSINLNTNYTQKVNESITVNNSNNNYLSINMNVNSDGAYNALVQIVDPYEDVTFLVPYKGYNKTSYNLGYTFRYTGTYRLYVKLYDNGIYKEYTLYINIKNNNIYNPKFDITYNTDYEYNRLDIYYTSTNKYLSYKAYVYDTNDYYYQDVILGVNNNKSTIYYTNGKYYKIRVEASDSYGNKLTKYLTIQK